MTNYSLGTNQFDIADLDAPDCNIIIEALQDIAANLTTEETWTCKGNYRLAFWIDYDKPSTVFCNAFVLANPDDLNDSTTLDFSYYFEIKRDTK